FPVNVVEVVPDEKIVLTWEAAPEGDGSGNYDTTVTMVFEPLDDNTRTLVSITEQGWKQTETGLKSSYNNCEGWTGMLAAMKAYVEHGINLRDGFYK
ncbi:MAG: ATPase, partial [Rhizobiales bacterium]|nr:ATPase [Hyphomicrobiales bacterium]